MLAIGIDTTVSHKNKWIDNIKLITIRILIISEEIRESTSTYTANESK